MDHCDKALVALICAVQDASMLLGFLSALASFSVLLIGLQMLVYALMLPTFFKTSSVITVPPLPALPLLSLQLADVIKGRFQRRSPGRFPDSVFQNLS